MNIWLTTCAETNDLDLIWVGHHVVRLECIGDSVCFSVDFHVALGKQVNPVQPVPIHIGY